MAELKDLFSIYTGLELPKEEKKQEIITPTFSRNNFVWDYIETKSKEKKEEKKEESEVEPVYDNQVEENPWMIDGYTKIAKARRVNNKQGHQEFQNQLDKYFINNPQDEGYRDMLTNLAAMESSYNQYAQNPWSSALGYFQFVDGTRKRYNTMSRDKFANDSQEQIRVAIAHLKDLKNDIQRNINTKTITDSGLTPLQLMYGMWWRPKSMYNYLRTGKDDFQTKDGMNIKKILEKAS